MKLLAILAYCLLGYVILVTGSAILTNRHLQVKQRKLRRQLRSVYLKLFYAATLGAGLALYLVLHL